MKHLICLKAPRIFSVSFWIFILIILFTIISCKNNHPVKDYKEASKQNTPESYKAYIEKYPKGRRSVEAKVMIEKLRYREVLNLDSLKFLRDYINEFPYGIYRDSIKSLISKISTLKYNSLLKNLNLDELIRFIKEKPDERYTDAAKQLFLKDDYYNGIEIYGRLLKYENLCNFNFNSIEVPIASTYTATIGVYGCDKWDMYGHPPVLYLTFYNNSGENKEINLKGLDVIKIITKDNGNMVPVGFIFRNTTTLQANFADFHTKGYVQYRISDKDSIGLTLICPKVSTDDIIIFDEKLVSQINYKSHEK